MTTYEKQPVDGTNTAASSNGSHDMVEDIERIGEHTGYDKNHLQKTQTQIDEEANPNIYHHVCASQIVRVCIAY